MVLLCHLYQHKKTAETAKCVLRWCEDDANGEVLKCLADELVHLLQSCFQPGATCSKERGKMWGALRQHRTSSMYKTLWSGLLKSHRCEADPIFYQYVGDQLFKILQKKLCVLRERGTLQADVSLSYKEKNVHSWVHTESFEEED